MKFATIEVISALAIDPSDWYDRPSAIYKKFEDLKLSPDYSRRVLRLMNEWGRFYCRATKKQWDRVPHFRGPWFRKIQAAYQKRTKGGRASERLRGDLLLKAKFKLNRENYNWLWISLYFGLRPHEVDSLHDKENWEVTYNGKHNFDELRVKQPKIGGEVKVIPIDLKEQKEALKMIEGGTFKRPIYKTMRKVFGDRIKLYGGRKEFANLMDSLDYDFIAISTWMGHRSPHTTLRYYKDKKEVVYAKKNKAA